MAHLETGILIVVVVILVANLVAVCYTRSRTKKEGRVKRLLVLVMVAALLGGCTTGNPNMFSGKPVIQLDQGAFFVSYIKVSMAYAVFKYQMTEWCAAKAVPAATCSNMAATDTMIQKIAEEINTSLQNPQYPIDMQKVQMFMDLVLSTLVKVGVKGITGGLMP